MENGSGASSRREFLQGVAVAAAVVAIGVEGIGAEGQEVAAATENAVPWYRRVLRWGQTNITEADVGRYDIEWWRKHWKETETQGVVVNAGGIVAYYPSKFELHYRAKGIGVAPGERDLYGEIVKAARGDGVAVLARMDSSKAHAALYTAHPEWFAVDAEGRPYRSGEFYLSCINTGYYTEWLPGIMREIIERSRPEGITDNGWASTGRESICYCAGCVEKFKAYAGKGLPGRVDWNDAVYRQWVEWGYARRIEQWEFNNRVTREAGGKECLWLGMVGSDVASMANSLRDVREIARRSEMVMLDNQGRSDRGTVGENAVDGKLMHGVLGWEKLIPESMAMYQWGRPQFRFSTKSPAEARMWMVSGIAGGIQPWWHHLGAYGEDRRMYATAGPVMKWHRANEEFLVNRRPVANVGIGWSQRNVDYFGRENAEEAVGLPMRGFVQAMQRARIPFLPVCLEDLEMVGGELDVLVLPNVGAMSDGQVAWVKKFVARGGSVVASGQTGLFDERGNARGDFALAEEFGVSGGKGSFVSAPAGRGGGRQTLHSYLRLVPELRAQVAGPHAGEEPAVVGKRHEVLRGFEETDLLSFGGTLGALKVAEGAEVLATFVPAFPQFPPEDVWMRVPKTDIPGLVVNEKSGGRVAYLAADLDRHYAVENFPDQGELLANLVRWGARGKLLLEVKGAGLVNCELYRQEGRMILHVVNLTSAGAWRAPIEELVAIGPLEVGVRVPAGIEGRGVRMLVGGGEVKGRVENGWVRFSLERVVDHEVVVVG